MTLKQLIYSKLISVPADVYLALVLLFTLMAYYHFNHYQWVQGAINQILGLIMGFLRGQAVGYKDGIEAATKVKDVKQTESTDTVNQ